MDPECVLLSLFFSLLMPTSREVVHLWSLVNWTNVNKCNFSFFAKCDLSANKSRTHSGECDHQQELQVQPVIANDDVKKTKAILLYLVLYFVLVSWPLTTA